jgi:hypothetical protein
MQNIVDLLSIHRELELATDAACHEALGDGDRCRQWLDEQLRWHLQTEDRFLLPVYIERVPEPPRMGRADLLDGDHRAIENLLDQAGATEGMERLVVLRRLTHLLEHHDQREAEVFKPLMDEVLGIDERQRILAQIMALRPSVPRPSAPVTATFSTMDPGPIRQRLDAARSAVAVLPDPFGPKARQLIGHAAELARQQRFFEALDRVLSAERMIAAAHKVQRREA